MPNANTKLSVSGIGEFKSAMQQARTATRTLDSEMKLAQAQFKATGDAQTYLQQRSQILSRQITQQERAVQAARDALSQMATEGVEPSSAAYQNMQRAAYDAERELVRLRQEADRTGDELLDTSTSADKLDDRLSSITKGVNFQNITSALRGASTVVSQVADKVTQLINGVKEAAAWADDLNTTAAQYGLSAEDLQRWDRAAKRVDVEVDAILKARDRLMNKAYGEDVLFVVDGINQYGVALKDAEGQARDSMDIFWDFIDVLGRVKNATDQDALAQEYFGKSFRQIKTLIDAGREGWEGYMREASITSQENVDSLNKANDAIDEFNLKLETARHNLAATQAGNVGNLYRMGSNLLVASGAVEGNLDLKDNERQLVQNTAGAVESYANWFQSTFGGILDFFGLKKPETQAEAGQAGSDMAAAFAAGVDANAEAAAAAGARLAAYAAAGMAASAGGNTTNNTQNQYFGDTYVMNATGNPELSAQLAANHRRQAAGYGG